MVAQIKIIAMSFMILPIMPSFHGISNKPSVKVKYDRALNKIYLYIFGGDNCDLQYCISYKYELNEIISVKYCWEGEEEDGKGGRLGGSHFLILQD